MKLTNIGILSTNQKRSTGKDRRACRHQSMPSESVIFRNRELGRVRKSPKKAPSTGKTFGLCLFPRGQGTLNIAMRAALEGHRMGLGKEQPKRLSVSVLSAAQSHHAASSVI